MSESTATYPELTRARNIAAGIGVIGVVLALIGLFLPGCAPHFFRGWLVGFNIFMGATTGALVLIMIQYLTGGLWAFSLRRTWEAATRNLPLMAVLLVPILFGMEYIYEWARWETAHKNPELIVDGTIYQGLYVEDHEYEHKYPLLNRNFFLVRMVIYFAIWGTLTYIFNKWSVQLDQTRDRQLLDQATTLAGPGIVLHVLVVTFASLDWAMSVEARWFSTMYGPKFGVGQMLTAYSICLLVYLLMSSYRPELEKQIKGQTMSDQGTLLGAFSMIWAYLCLMEFMIIWMGQLPEELPYFDARMMRAPWMYVAIALAVLGYAAPFLLLLNPHIKRVRSRLTAIVFLVCCVRVLDNIFLLVPGFDQGTTWVPDYPVYAYVMYPAAIVGIGGLWFAGFFWNLGMRSMVPSYSTQEAWDGSPVQQHA
ncbi:MAG: hypothetical protein SNJ75_09680 [Gemmataceae bacterium]